MAGIIGGEVVPFVAVYAFARRGGVITLEEVGVAVTAIYQDMAVRQGVTGLSVDLLVVEYLPPERRVASLAIGTQS
jgi:hypothetical protein